MVQFRRYILACLWDQRQAGLLHNVGEPVIPPRRTRKVQHNYDKQIYKKRNLVEWFVNGGAKFGVRPWTRTGDV